MSFALLAACNSEPLERPLTEAAVSSALQVSESSARSGSTSLKATAVSGDVFIFTGRTAAVEKVDFYLDDPDASSRPRQTEYHAPFDFAGTNTEGKANPFDTTSLKNGSHTVTAVFSLKNGRRDVVKAEFRVENGGSESPPAPKNVLWSADHEAGNLSQWHEGSCGGEFNSGGGVSEATRDVAHSGRYAAKLALENVNTTQGVRLFRWCESRQNSELYYSTWFYFPELFRTRANWWNVFQFKSKRPSGQNDPFFILNVGNRSDGDMYFYLYGWQVRRSYSQASKDIPVGQWVHVEAYYRSAGDESGQITVWQDGTKIFDVDGVRTRYADGDTQWSVDNYTSSIAPDPAVIYVDDGVISKTRVGPTESVASLP